MSKFRPPVALPPKPLGDPIAEMPRWATINTPCTRCGDHDVIYISEPAPGELIVLCPECCKREVSPTAFATGLSCPQCRSKAIGLAGGMRRCNQCGWQF